MVVVIQLRGVQVGLVRFHRWNLKLSFSFEMPPKRRTQTTSADPLYFHRGDLRLLQDLMTFQEQDSYLAVSIDPGYLNPAFRVEANHSDGTIETISYHRIECGCRNFDAMTKFLEQYRKLFRKCQVFAIEDQLAIARMDVLNMAQHILSYLLITINHDCCILLVNTHLKGDILGYSKPKHGTVKEWSVWYACRDFKRHDDREALELLRSNKKSDDLADTYVQLKAIRKFVCQENATT